MAEVIYLKAHQTPPEDQDWVLIERTAQGNFHVVATAQDGDRALAVLNQGPFAGLLDALEAAQKRAMERGIVDIYVKGVAHD